MSVYYSQLERNVKKYFCPEFHLVLGIFEDRIRAPSNLDPINGNIKYEPGLYCHKCHFPYTLSILKELK